MKDASVPTPQSVLTAHEYLWNEAEQDFLANLIAAEYAQFLCHFDVPGVCDDKKKQLVHSLMAFDQHFATGLMGYITEARTLLRSLNPAPAKDPQALSSLALSKDEVRSKETDLQRTGLKEADLEADLGSAGYSYPSPYEKLGVDKIVGAAGEDLRRVGLSQLPKVVFVLVAGGMGERLGANDIKLALPTEPYTARSFLATLADYHRALKQYYHESLGDLGDLGEELKKSFLLPLVIMVSPHTAKRTQALLAEHDYFSFAREEIIFLEQSLVPAVKNWEGELSFSSPYTLNWKPPGHGSIHELFWKHGLGKKFLALGKEFVITLQDTNMQLFQSLLPALGHVHQSGAELYFLGTERSAGEKLGVLLRHQPPQLTEADSVVMNVEYNLVKTLGLEAEGDDSAREQPSASAVTFKPSKDSFGASSEGSGLEIERAEGKGEKTFKRLPANINTFILRLAAYESRLEATQGRVRAFINPKLDKTGKVFLKPTRIETLMQDIALFFKGVKATRVVILERLYAFAAMKNALGDVRAAKDSAALFTALQMEEQYFESLRQKLELVTGSRIERTGEFYPVLERLGICHDARVILPSAWVLFPRVLQEHVKNCDFARNSLLMIEGEGVYLENVRLQAKSTLIIRVGKGVRLWARDLNVANAPTTFRFVTPEALEARERAKTKGNLTPPNNDKNTENGMFLRGYTIEWPRGLARDHYAITVTVPGDYEIIMRAGKLSHSSLKASR